MGCFNSKQVKISTENIPRPARPNRRMESVHTGKVDGRPMIFWTVDADLQFPPHL